MDVFRIVVNAVSLIINIFILYYSISLLRLFRGGMVSKPWLYISGGAILISVSSFLFLFCHLIGSELIHRISIIIMVLGGLLMLLGLRKEYTQWQRLSRQA